MQGTFSRLFGKKHGTAAASLFATNPPWIFSQEVTSDSAGGTGQCCPSRVLPSGKAWGGAARSAAGRGEGLPRSHLIPAMRPCRSLPGSPVPPKAVS